MHGHLLPRGRGLTVAGDGAGRVNMQGLPVSLEALCIVLWALRSVSLQANNAGVCDPLAL